MKAKDYNLPPEAEIPFYDYNLRVDEVIASDSGTQVGDTVVLRMFVADRKQPVTSATEHPPSIPGERYLFFLYRNPDNTTYRLKYGPASRLTVDGPIVTFSDRQRSPVTFVPEPLAEGSPAPQPQPAPVVMRQSLPGFIQMVRAIVGSNGKNGLR